MDSIRDDGTVEIHEIEWYDSKQDSWHGAGDTLHAKIPEELRWEDPLVCKATPLFKGYNEAWQVCGIHGWFSLDDAMKVMQLLATYVRKYKFRVVHRVYSKKTTVLAEMQMPPDPRVKDE